MRVLATLLTPDAGQARICGYDVTTDAVQVRQLIAVTWQYASVDDELTGAENLIMIVGHPVVRRKHGRQSIRLTRNGFSLRGRKLYGANPAWPGPCTPTGRSCG